MDSLTCDWHHKFTTSFIVYRLSFIVYRLSFIVYRLSFIVYRFIVYRYNQL